MAPKLFRLRDLAVPIGSGLLAAALCAWGTVEAVTLPAKVICVLTGVAFLGSILGWYLMRWSYIKYDFQTVQGLLVRRGKLNRPEKAVVEKWTDELVDFWGSSELSKVYPLTPRDIKKTLDGVWVSFSDEAAFFVRRSEGTMGFVYGYARASEIGVCHPPMAASVNARETEEAAVRGLFRHELSHVIVEKQAKISVEDEHHRIFRDAKLGG